MSDRVHADSKVMAGGRVLESSTARLFAVYMVTSLALVVVVGLVLSASIRSEADQRGLTVGTSKALLLQRTAVEAHLDGRSFSEPLSIAEAANLEVLTQRAMSEHDILRLRLRDMTGRVVWSDDGSGFGQDIEGEVLDATHGILVSQITNLNADSVDSGDEGEKAVETYSPLLAGNPARQVGVLELYLPYAPIEAEVQAGMSSLYRDLVVGLAILYVGLFLVSVYVSRGLRRQVRVNKYLAQHDTLTDLPNRATFLEFVDAAIAAGDDPPVAVAIIDLDRFKEVNDTLGHQYGDQLLTQLARRLAEHLRGRDRVARLGGDEFGIVLRDTSEPEAALWRIREVIEREVHVDGLPVTLNSSIGFALAPADGGDADVLLRRADVAMYVAKARHAGVLRYDAALDHYDTANLALLADVRRALRRDELTLHYQPKIRLSDGHIVAIEALLRWQHPSLGLLAPDRFVPLIEQTDLIDDLTDWVLARALRDLAEIDQHHPGLTVAVNVSARNLARDDFPARVGSALFDHDVAPERLVVEITETALLGDPGHAARVLLALSDLGVLVSLDDFGVGQTSLAYLAALPIDELKIDRGFVTDMTADASHAAIVRSIVDLAHNLSLRVVAEGVETAEASHALIAAGCDLAQGFLYSRPVPLDGLRTRLDAELADVS